MTEIWKNIENYEGLYQVSNFGRVKSLGNGNSNNSKERILKAANRGLGYLFVTLCKNGEMKHFNIHRLVAQAFIPNPENLPQINHIDEDKTNNSAENLEWCTCVYNINHGTRNQRVAKAQINGKTSKLVQCLETGKVYPSTMEIERQFGFANANISKCCLGKRNQAYGYHWEYIIPQ